MKTLLNLFIQIIILNIIVAQYTPARPYEKLEFESIDPLYHTTFFDSNYKELGSDGYNCFADLQTVEPLVFNNYIFTIYYNYISSPGLFGSYYINCTNLDDGSLVWQNRLISDNITNIEVPRLLIINENNELVVTGHKKKTIYDGEQYISDGLIFHRIYNINNGNLIDIFHRSFNDSMAYNTEYLLYYTSLFFYDNSNNLRIVERINSAEITGFKSYLLDKTGKIIGNPDTILYSYFNDFVNNANIAVIGEDSLLMIEIGLDDINAFILLRYLTYDLKVINEVKIVSPVIDNLPYIRLMDVSQKQNLVLLNIRQYDSNTQSEYNLELVLNKSGDILKNFSIPLDYDVLSWENSKEIQTYNVLFNYKNNPTLNNIIQFMSCESDSTCKLLKEHKVLDPLRFGFITKYFDYKDKQIVLFNEGSLKFHSNNVNVIDDLAIAKSILAFKKGDFLPELLSSSSNFIHDVNITTIKTFPNPSSGPLFLDIKGITGKADVRIYDMLGRNVYVQDGITEGETTMDLSGLTVGTYIYKIYQGSKEIGSGQWVRI